MVANRMRYLIAKKSICLLLLLACSFLMLSEIIGIRNSDNSIKHYYAKSVGVPAGYFALGNVQLKGIKDDENLGSAIGTKLLPSTDDHARVSLDPEQIVLVLKTGRAVYRDRLMSQLETFASARYRRSKTNTIIISDHNDTLSDSDLLIHDVVAPLARVSQIAQHRKFTAYLNEINRLGTNHSTAEAVVPGTNNDGWVVDALKFIPGYKLAAETFPNARWFVGIDDDTYVNWENILEFLSLLDHKKEYYLGTPSIMLSNKVKFHHGGSIILLSQAAMYKRFIEKADDLEQYNIAALERCCGDGVLSMAFTDIGIPPDDQYMQLFNSHRPEEIAVWRDNFCLPILGLHHADAASMRSLGNKLMKRDDTYRGKLGAFTSWGQMLRIIAANETGQTGNNLVYRNDWDFLVLSQNEDKILVNWDDKKSASVCRHMCEAKALCLGWLFVESELKCWLANTVSPGRSAEGAISGLSMKKIEGMENACKQQDWRQDVLRL